MKLTFKCGTIHFSRIGFGGIAQLGERLLDKQEVTGSKPVVPTKSFIPNPTQGPFFGKVFCFKKNTYPCSIKCIVIK